MNRLCLRAILSLTGSMCVTTAQAAVDSYRFVHVTISTPWYIFIFLMMGVFVPFVLMAVLAWRNAIRKSERDDADADYRHSEK